MTNTARSYKDCQSCGMPMSRDKKAEGPMPMVQRVRCTVRTATKLGPSRCRTSRLVKCGNESDGSFTWSVFQASPHGSWRARFPSSRDGTKCSWTTTLISDNVCVWPTASQPKPWGAQPRTIDSNQCTGIAAAPFFGFFISKTSGTDSRNMIVSN